MSEDRVILDTAAFLDSEQARGCVGCTREERQSIVQRFLQACYQDLGRVPRLLDGEGMSQLLGQALARYYAVRDPLIEKTEAVLLAYLDFLEAEQVVTQAFEVRAALAAKFSVFQELVQSGAAHADGLAVTGPGKTVHHQVERVGRNDPCPCGSGKKFKKCCWQLGKAT